MNSIAESGATANDIHDQRVAQLDSMNKSAITVDCRYVPPESGYEEGGNYFKNDCDTYLRIDPNTQDRYYVECMIENRRYHNQWIYSRVLTKTIPVWSKCPDSVEVGYNKYTNIWKILN